jgi:8-oxo-dGTP pyrophosphatase MutT (NUDIX family)
MDSATTSVAADSETDPLPAAARPILRIIGIMRVVRRAARAILIDDDERLVVFKRTLPKRKVYWSTPGGGIDSDDSSIEAALHRELAEELGAVADRVQQVFVTSTPRGNGIAVQHFFVCRLVSMDLAARTGAEFSNPAKGRYDVERIDLRGRKLSRYNLQPPQVRDFILANRHALLGVALHDVPPLTDPAPTPAATVEPEPAAEPAPAAVGAGSTRDATTAATAADVRTPDAPQVQTPATQPPDGRPPARVEREMQAHTPAADQARPRQVSRRPGSQLVDVTVAVSRDAPYTPPPPRRRRRIPFRRR